MSHLDQEVIKLNDLQENLNNNGFVFQRKSELNYKGIEGDNWYLNYYSDDPYFADFYDHNIDKAWNNMEYVDCCIDEKYIKKYIEESVKQGIDFRILMCSTCMSKPTLKKGEKFKLGDVLGYDYAYSGGSYYSCVLNDIISQRIKELRSIQLNKNGLFNTYEEAVSFGNYREKLRMNSDDYNFEEGNFIVYKITEVFF